MSRSLYVYSHDSRVAHNKQSEALIQREHLFGGASLARLLLHLGAAETWWRCANLTGDARSVADVTVMDGRRDAVVLLQVDLKRQSVRY